MARSNNPAIELGRYNSTHRKNEYRDASDKQLTSKRSSRRARMSASAQLLRSPASVKNQQSPGSRGSDEDEHEHEHEHENWSGEESNGDRNGQDVSRKRKRPMSVSCELCKQRKVKCDRGQPSCGWCVRNNQVCEYKERKKPGLRAGYGRELEARLDRLEGIIKQHQFTLAQVVSNSNTPLQMHPEAGYFKPSSAVQAPHIPRPETALFLQKPPTFPQQTPLLTDYGALNGQSTPSMAPNAGYQSSMPSERMHQHSVPGLASATRDLYSQSNPALESPSLNIPGESQPSLNSGEHDFPPYDLLYALVDLFFKHINTWCPILHRRSTLDSLFGPSMLDDGDRILLHAIVATTLRFSNDVRLTDESRERYHSGSKQRVLLYGLENSSVKALQAMVILALDLVGDSNGPPGWNLLALITRSVVQLGLAVESDSASVSPKYPSIYTLRAMVLPEPKDWIEEESRRRLFWMVYLLDRYATIATAFEFALDEKEIDRRLPCRDDLFARNQPVETRWFRTSERDDYSLNKPENLGSFSYYIEIIGILSRIHQFLKKPVDIGALSDVEQWQREYRDLDNALTAWKFSLPNEYGNMARVFSPSSGNKIVNCGWVMLHAAYHTTVIRLHSSAAYPTTRSPIFTPSYSASQRCLGAVENIVALCDYVRSNLLLSKLGPPFAFTLWVAARLLLVHGSTLDAHVNPAIHTLVAALRIMGSHWAVASRYATLLSRVLDEYGESAAAPVIDAATGRRETPSSVRILADMRRCAFDLDFLISRQPRHPQAAVAAAAARLASVTPRARSPALPSELEYLDVFDFFNVPRLPVGMEGNGNGNGNGNENGVAGGNGVGSGGGNGHGSGGDGLQIPEFGTSEFNITNFSFDANSDWFLKNPA